MTPPHCARRLLNACLAGMLAAVVLLAASDQATAAEALDVNTAPQAELERIKGIGVAMSERLLKARAEAPFADWQDLLARVHGLGPRLAQRLSAQGLRVNGERFELASHAGVPGSAASR